MTVPSLDRSSPPTPADLRPFGFPQIEEHRLSNGLPVVFARTGELPVATISLLLPAGALREGPGQEGVATLTGSLLESGTAEMDATAVSQSLERLGVRLNAGTSWEISHVDFTALTDRLEKAGDLMGRLVRDPGFPQEEVERLRGEQLASILQRRAEPRGFANELAAHYIYSDESPFSRPLIGTTASVGSLDRSHVAAYHSRTFTPDGATIVAAGRVDGETILAQAERMFGDWRGSAPVPFDPVVRPRSDRLQVIIWDRPGAVQSEIRVGHVGIPRKTPDYFAIVVMNAILGGAFSSRLNMNLRERHGFTYSASSTFVMRRFSGLFLVSAAVQTEVTGAAIREMLNELEGIRAEKVTSSELANARLYVAGTFPLSLQTSDGVASKLAELATYDLPRTYLSEFSTRILAVDEEQVLAAARTRIRPEALSIFVLGDAASLRPQLEALQLADVQVFGPEKH